MIPLTVAAYVRLLSPEVMRNTAFLGMLGLILGYLFRFRYRSLGIVPFAFSLATLFSCSVAWFGQPVARLAEASFFLGFAISRLARSLGDADPSLTWVQRLLVGVGIYIAFFLNAATFVPSPEKFESRFDWFAVVIGLLAVFTWSRLARPAIELACEPIIRLQYRIRSVGPGVVQIPMHGPSIVIANHACWFDPFFLALLLPRPITPMMTSDFYDLPVAHWLLKRVFHAIRVPEKSLKQDVPDEIRQAIAALDRGECVVIFPEGMLRRSDEKPLKRFGRGIWQILVARPDTPVFACWIEGGWRSYCSYFNGPPTKNKRPDFRRRIDVAVPAPIQLDAETLSKHLTTRIALMNAVLESRKLLNLPEVPAFELPKVE